RLETTAGDAGGGREYRAQTVSAYLAARGLLAAVNGGYFTPFRGGSPGGDDYYPRAGDPVDVSGAAIAFGRVVSPVEPTEDERVNAIVCIAGAVVEIRDGQTCGGAVDHAMAAGPRLLAAGAVRPFDAFGADYAAARHPRTAIGLDADAPRAWIVVADGRQPGFSEGMSLNELSALFRELGAEDAINLDGGGSSTMALAGPDAVRVVNSPIHTAVPGRERPSANHLGVRAAP
ncbi:MAG: phosphodiester glycosidase family protein, partial [Phycisphaerae bacterium]|nr:phosphodiester glycosidase family protein [Phycisphaerae bacterium]